MANRRRYVFQRTDWQRRNPHPYSTQAGCLRGDDEPASASRGPIVQSCSHYWRTLGQRFSRAPRR